MEDPTLTTDATNTTDSATSQTADTSATAADSTSQTAATADITDATTETTTETDKPAGAPETYEFAAPEGQTFDSAVIDAYSSVAKELDLPQDKAQKILDTVAPVLAARQAEQFEGLKSQWADESRADKEFGGDKLNENLALAHTARDAFATPELRTLLDTSGMGNNPEVIRLFYRVGKAISEDSFKPGRGSAGDSAGSPQKLYAASNMNP